MGIMFICFVACHDARSSMRSFQENGYTQFSRIPRSAFFKYTISQEIMHESLVRLVKARWFDNWERYDIAEELVERVFHVCLSVNIKVVSWMEKDNPR